MHSAIARSVRSRSSAENLTSRRRLLAAWKIAPRLTAMPNISSKQCACAHNWASSFRIDCVCPSYIRPARTISEFGFRVSDVDPPRRYRTCRTTRAGPTRPAAIATPDSLWPLRSRANQRVHAQYRQASCARFLPISFDHLQSRAARTVKVIVEKGERRSDSVMAHAPVVRAGTRALHARSERFPR